jgi:plasmid stabilization system protein ParE
VKLEWTRPAIADLARLHAFLDPVSPRAAAAVVRNLQQGALPLLTFPRLGQALGEYRPRDVSRLIIGDYELRYEVIGDTVFVVRVWHCREDR